MKWNNDIPNKKGYYWYKDKSMGKPVILFVTNHDGGWYAQDEEYSFVVEPEDGVLWCYVPEPN
jgi:hypothetical protein